MIDVSAIVSKVSRELEAGDFYGGLPLLPSHNYMYAAEQKINKMSNMELLELLEVVS